VNVDTNFAFFEEVKEFKKTRQELIHYKKVFSFREGPMDTHRQVTVYFSWEENLSSFSRLSPKDFATKTFDHYSPRLIRQILKEQEVHEKRIDNFWGDLEDFCEKHKIEDVNKFFLEIVEK
jgi:predicted ribosome quality control (RQC) complex YloA/Tae2 family protein